MGLESVITLNENFIEIKNSQSETKYLPENFEYISETRDNFFIKLKSGIFLTFAKNQIKNQEALRNYFQQRCEKSSIAYIDDQNWTWK